MIYWFTGQPGAGKTIQATKLKDLLQTEKRNWRKDVFHIDGDDLREGNIVEIYVHTNRKRQREQFKVEGYEIPEINFFDMDTTSDNPVQSFTKLVHFLRENDKI